MTVSIIRGGEAMVGLRGAWHKLAAPRQNPLLEFDWFDCCVRSLHKNDLIHLMVVKDRFDDIVAIAPLVKTVRDSREWFELIGTSQLHEPSGLLYLDSTALQSLFRGIAQLRYPTSLGRLPLSTDNATTKPRRAIRSGLWLQIESAGTPVLDLSKGWDDFLQCMSARRRADHRRAVRRAHELGESRFEAHDPTPEDVPALLDIAFDVEDRSWKGRSGSSLNRNNKIAAFIQDYALRAASQRSLRVFIQYLGNTPAAMAICVEIYDALWFLKIGYDEDFQSFSPGILQLMNIIAFCCENNISRIEHLGTNEPWLMPWTTYVSRKVTYVHYPSNAKGICAISYDISRAVHSRLSRLIRTP